MSSERTLASMFLAAFRPISGELAGEMQFLRSDQMRYSAQRIENERLLP